MEQNTIPNTDIKVSKICLGTMTFGNQNTESDGHEQMDYAIDNGVNFLTQPNSIPFLPMQKHREKQIVSLDHGLKKMEIGIKSFWPQRSLGQENTQNTFGKI